MDENSKMRLKRALDDMKANATFNRTPLGNVNVSGRNERHTALAVIADCFVREYYGDGKIAPSDVRTIVSGWVDEMQKHRYNAPEGSRMLRIPVFPGESLADAARRFADGCE